MLGGVKRKWKIVMLMVLLGPMVAVVLFFSNCIYNADYFEFKDSDYVEALKSCEANVSYANELKAICPESKSIIKNYNSRVEKPVFVMKTGFYDRYLLEMTIPVELNSVRTNLENYGVPRFHLQEYS
jgi:hypothetical protein